MGITTDTAKMIIAAYKHRPLDGKVLVCGRQSMYFTPAEAAAMLRAAGIEPRIRPEDCQFDIETCLGGENQPHRDSAYILDKSFFKMLGVEDLCFLDHSNYEGADSIIDLNLPLPTTLESRYDFIIDGGTLDNVFNPSQTIMNIARMLRPKGRLLTYNLYSNTYCPYTMLPHQWYIDYFAINEFDFAQVYIKAFDIGGVIAVYQVNLDKRAASNENINNFPHIDPSIALGSVCYAIKGENSTSDRSPSQEIYRDLAGWEQTRAAVARFAAYPLPGPIARSRGTTPIVMPGVDDFGYVCSNGEVLYGHEQHDELLKPVILANLQAMSRRFANQKWGIVETEKLFFDLLPKDAFQEIIANDNVILFDTRMLNTSVRVRDVDKKIWPTAHALAMDIPLLVMSSEMGVDALWKRLPKYFKHLQAFSGVRTNGVRPLGDPASLMSYAKTSLQLSPSLEYGEYKFHPRDNILDLLQEQTMPA